MNIYQTLSTLEQIARRLDAKDVIGLLDDVDRYGRMYASRVVIVGGVADDQRRLAGELAGRELDREWAAWGEFGVSTEARAGIGAEIVVSLDEDTPTYAMMSGLFLMRSEFVNVETLREAVQSGLARRAELQDAALKKVAKWCLEKLESLPHPPAPSPQVERGSRTSQDQLKGEVDTEINYLLKRLEDDFESLRYRKATVDDLDSFNAAVNVWLVSETEMIGTQLGGLIGRVSRDMQQMGVSIERLPDVPVLNVSAPELTTRPIPPDDRLRTAVSLGGGGLIAVVSQVLLSQGPVAALATGAAAGVAAYVALGQKKGEAADPVGVYFELMARTTIAGLRGQIEGIGAALMDAITPAETIIEAQADEVGQLLAQVREALGNS